MRVLAIEASTSILSVCVLDGDRRAEAALDRGLAHAERLMPLVEFCMHEAGLRPTDLDLLACSEGPGSFTGLRIGMSAVKGMAMGLGKPWVAVPSLDCLAWGIEQGASAVMPVIDGKKGRHYAAVYLRGRREGPWLDAGPEEIARAIDRLGSVFITGPDADDFAELAASRSGITIDPRPRRATAHALALLGIRRLAEEGPFPDDAAPLYLRPSEAEETAAREALPA